MTIVPGPFAAAHVEAPAGDAAASPPWPLNQSASFEVWPAFDPDHFLDMNPSFVRLGPDCAWCVFCRYARPAQPGRGSLWAVRVDEAMRPIGQPTLLIGSGIDPRVVTLGDRVMLFFALIERDTDDIVRGSSMALADYAVQGDAWTCQGLFQLPSRPVTGQQSADSQQGWEKNWVPFPVDDGTVGLIYAHEPWHVLTLDVGPGRPPHLTGVESGQAVTWDYGTARGGTPPVPYDDHNLITFFHSAQVLGSRRVYHVGACVFSAQAPFAPVLSTREPILTAAYRTGAERFGWAFAGSVVFPLGAERTPDGYRLLCGLDDGEIGSFLVRSDALAPRLTAMEPGGAGVVHDYAGHAARLPPRPLVYVPDAMADLPEWPMVHFLKVLAGRGRTFVDVGSRIGFYTMGLAPGFRRVVAFEPSPVAYGWLTRNRALNDYRHVSCEHVALGDGVESHATSAPDIWSVEALDDRGLTDVDLMTIRAGDSEGAVLRGARRTIAASRPVILIDAGRKPDRREAVAALMEEIGYGFEPIFPRAPEWVLCLAKERRHDFAWFV